MTFDSPMSQKLAEALADRVADSISGFPDVSNEERAKIAESVAEQLGEYADHQRGAA